MAESSEYQEYASNLTENALMSLRQAEHIARTQGST